MLWVWPVGVPRQWDSAVPGVLGQADTAKGGCVRAGDRPSSVWCHLKSWGSAWQVPGVQQCRLLVTVTVTVTNVVSTRSSLSLTLLSSARVSLGFSGDSQRAGPGTTGNMPTFLDPLDAPLTPLAYFSTSSFFFLLSKPSFSLLSFWSGWRGQGP